MEYGAYMHDCRLLCSHLLWLPQCLVLLMLNFGLINQQFCWPLSLSFQQQLTSLARPEHMPCYKTGCKVIPSPERVTGSTDESPLHVRTVVNCPVKSLLPKLNCPPPQSASKVNLLLESFLFFLVLKRDHHSTTTPHLYQTQLWLLICVQCT